MENQEKLICPKCKELGMKSMVTGGGGARTMMYCAPYYDEDGNYHNHDRNSTGYSYRCSNGHVFCISKYMACPTCGWKVSEDVVTVR